jgi:hypothetical protein
VVGERETVPANGDGCGNGYRRGIVQIVGHGEVKTPIGDAFTIRFCDATWQYRLKGYGKRTDVYVTVENRTGKTPGAQRWHYSPQSVVPPGDFVDITGYARGYNGKEQWLSTGSAAIIAAWEILEPKEIVLYGFTALESGKHASRVPHQGAGGRKACTTFHEYGRERMWLESQGINFRFVS